MFCSFNSDNPVVTASRIVSAALPAALYDGLLNIIPKRYILEKKATGDIRLYIKNIQYFLTVAEERNITAAAKKLHISQPPLSRQLKSLENQNGSFPEPGKTPEYYLLLLWSGECHCPC